jgi:hypothetical protein
MQLATGNWQLAENRSQQPAAKSQKLLFQE